MAWSASQYVKFEDERTRPPRDLLAQVPLDHVARGVDLGCGPGNSTELLIERFGAANISGLDSDDDMLAAAAKRLPYTTFRQGRPCDLGAGRGRTTCSSPMPCSNGCPTIWRSSSG